MLITEGVKITDNLANQSVLALLYGSEEAARDVARSSLAFPGVDYVVMFDREMSLVYGEGERLPTYNAQQVRAVDSTVLIDEDRSAWHFAATVHTADSNDGELGAIYTVESEQELLGYVYVTVKKDALHRLEAITFANNLATALVFALVLLVILHMILKKMTRPLDALSQLMGQAEKGQAMVYAKPEGPKEVVSIARAFNRMIEAIAERDRRLREQNVTLEAQVALRTRELVHARDLALEASRNKSEFLANMSHELRTPLQAIIGYADMVLESLRDEHMLEHTDDVERIMHNADHLLNLINTILDFAKSESASLEVNIAKIDLKQILAKAEQAVRPIADANGNTMKIDDGDISEVCTDGSKLLHILINLMGNAAKFTQHGKININCVIENDEFLLTVADTGVGMSELDQQCIFEPFRQVDGSETRMFHGTGLGLAIVKRYAEVLGGEVNVSSAPKKGAVFTVKLPMTGLHGAVSG